MTIKRLILVCCTLTFFSCEEEITVDMPNPEKKIVVEGIIENGKAPFVLLTRNAPYFGEVDTSKIVQEYLVAGAEVTVSDGSTIDTLISIFPGYYVGSILGKVETNYNLKIVAEGKTITASTYIPNPVNKPDSLWFTYKEGYQDVVRIWIRYTDPDTLGNMIRILTNVDDRGFKAFFYSVFDDKFVNGKTFDDILRNGNKESCYADNPQADTTQKYILQECGLFRYGDKVIIKIASIDVNNYHFWQTLEHGKADGMNPFASPTIIKSNINGGLGIWSGYGAVYDTLIVQ